MTKEDELSQENYALLKKISVLEFELKEAKDWQEHKAWMERVRFSESIDWARMVCAQDVWDAMTNARVKEEDARYIMRQIARK